jgi:hypothetical protein
MACSDDSVVTGLFVEPLLLAKGVLHVVGFALGTGKVASQCPWVYTYAHGIGMVANQGVTTSMKTVLGAAFGTLRVARTELAGLMSQEHGVTNIVLSWPAHTLRSVGLAIEQIVTASVLVFA